MSSRPAPERSDAYATVWPLAEIVGSMLNASAGVMARADGAIWRRGSERPERAEYETHTAAAAVIASRGAPQSHRLRFDDGSSKARSKAPAKARMLRGRFSGTYDSAEQSTSTAACGSRAFKDAASSALCVPSPA